MADPQSLYALAEISIAMVGFSAIVVLFRKSDSGTWKAEDADRFNGMLLHSMAATFFCFLPSLLGVFTSDPPLVWSISSGVLGIQVLAHSIVIFRLPSSDASVRVALVFGFAVAVLQGLNAVGVGYERVFEPYLVGVLWHIVQAGVLFISLVWVRATDTDATDIE